MSKTWEARLAGWMRTEQQRQAQAMREGANLREQVKALATNIDRLVTAQAKRSGESTERLRKLMAMQDDPVVLVRNYGGSVRVYHENSGECGWIGFAGGFDRILLTEAIDRGLRACSSCGYLVGRAA